MSTHDAGEELHECIETAGPIEIEDDEIPPELAQAIAELTEVQ